MEEGVYTYTYNDEKMSQTTFIKLTQIGMTHDKKDYKVNRISFTSVKPEIIFPYFKEHHNSNDKEFEFSPLVINGNFEKDTLTEGGPLYEFYNKNYKPCNIPFRFIEQLYENFISIKKSFNDIKKFTI